MAEVAIAVLGQKEVSGAASRHAAAVQPKEFATGLPITMQVIHSSTDSIRVAKGLPLECVAGVVSILYAPTIAAMCLPSTNWHCAALT